MGLMDTIRNIYKRRRRKGDLWAWAKKPRRMRRRYRRWRALAEFANKNRALNRSLGRLVQARAWTEARTEYRKKRRYLKNELDERDAPTTGVVTPAHAWNPYNKPIAAWMVEWLDKSRNAGWRGVLNSGYRSPEYSQQLCYQICGAPSCPGLCAGTSSNHTKHVKPEGAVDVSDYYNFAAIQPKIGSPLRNDLPNDRVHFSTSGH